MENVFTVVNCFQILAILGLETTIARKQADTRQL